MQETAQALRLSAAFQSALGTLATNAVVARRILAGECATTDLGMPLGEQDHHALQMLLAAEGERLLAVADIMTGRRRHKAELRLPAVKCVLGQERFDLYWQEYLGAGIQLGSPSAYAEASALTGWILCRIDSESFEAQVARFESCINAVMEELARRQGDEDAERIDLSHEDCMLHVSEAVRMERFGCAIERTMRSFQESQQLVPPAVQEPTELLFHPARGKLPGAAVSQLWPGMKVILQHARQGLSMRRLLQGTPAHRRSHVRAVVDELVSIRVLETRLGCNHGI